MADFYYVIKHDSTGKYLADSFYHLQWTHHLGKAKRFNKAGAEYTMCKMLSAHSILVYAVEVDERDLIEVEEADDVNNATG